MTTLYDDLRDRLARHPVLWMSESDFPVEVVRLTKREIADYHETFCGDGLLQQQVEQDRCGFLPLVRCFGGYSVSSYRKASGEPSVYDLLVVVREGDGFVGIRTKLVET